MKVVVVNEWHIECLVCRVEYFADIYIYIYRGKQFVSSDL